MVNVRLKNSAPNQRTGLEVLEKIGEVQLLGRKIHSGPVSAGGCYQAASCLRGHSEEGCCSS